MYLSSLGPSWKLIFCQCAYGLQLPGAKKHVYCQKNTCLLTNMESLRVIAAKCPGLSRWHSHEVAWGSKMVNGKSVRLAAAAGKYPHALCEKWAQAVKLASLLP